MNSVLVNSEDMISEIKEMVKNIDDMQSGIDMFEELIKKQIVAELV